MAWSLLLLVLLGSGGLGYAGWVYSTELLTPVRDAPAYDLDVVAVGDGTVTLERTDASDDPGVWGLEWAGGYGRVTEVVARDAGTVTRAFEPLVGEPDPARDARLDNQAWPDDPAAIDVPFSAVTYRSDVGELPAWLLAPDGGVEGAATWAVFVHGRGAHRAEGLRIGRVLRDLGLPTLLIAYRNDADAPASARGLYGLGHTEWRDVEAAVRFALDGGAERVVLVGASMGGMIVERFLLDSPLSGHAAAAILDAPVTDWEPVLDHEARRRGLPTLLVEPAQLVSTLRGGIDWSALGVTERAAAVDLPTLVFHGTADDTVPVSATDRFVAALPGAVTYVRVEGAGHVTSWNVDPQRYEAAVRGFLAEVLPLPPRDGG